MVDVATGNVRREAAFGIPKLSSIAVMGAALVGGAVGLLTSTAYPQLGDPASGAFASSGVVLTAVHLVMAAGVAGLIAQRVAGTGRLATVASGLALLGLAGQAVAEAMLRIDFAVGNALFGYVVPLMALGFVLLGVAVSRARTWTGWHRVTPLLCGLYVPMVLIPAFAFAHGPSFVALAVWQVLFLLLGVAMWAEARVSPNTTGGR